MAKFSTLGLSARDRIPKPTPRPGCHNVMAAPKAGREGRHRAAGLAVSRQRPGTVKGFAFLAIEDAPSRGQLIISPDPWDSHRTVLRDASVLLADVGVEDTGYQLALRAESLFARPAPIHVRWYHYV